MAKQTQSVDPSIANTSLAERLFAATWRKGSGFTDEQVALDCINAAEAFERVQREHAGLKVATTEAA